MCKLSSHPASGNATRSFRLIDPSTVVVTVAGRKTRYTLAIGTGSDCDGNPETIIALRSGREMFHVTLARDGSAMCHCRGHFDAGQCWHAELAAAIVKQLEAGKVLTVEAPDGMPLCRITSESGLCRSHRKLAELIRSKPFLLSNPEQVEALQESIAGTRLDVFAVAI